MKFFKTLCSAAMIAAATLTASAVDFTLVIPNPDAVLVTANSVKIDVVEGANPMSYSEYTNIKVTGVSPYIVKSVTNQLGTPQSVLYGEWSIYLNTSANGGQIYTIEVMNLDEQRTASFTLDVDDASKVDAVVQGYNTTLNLQNGKNVIKYDPAVETAVRISPAVYGTLIYQVTLNGEKVNPQGTSYNVNLSDGCVIDVMANYPDIDVDLNFTYSENGLGAIKSILVDGAEVPFDGEKASVKLGKQAELVANPDYKFTKVTLNGSNTYWTGPSNYKFTVTGESDFYVDAAPYAHYDITVNVNDPSLFDFYLGYSSYNNTPIKLEAGANTLSVLETVSYICWQIKAGAYFESITVDGKDVTSSLSAYIKSGSIVDIKVAEIKLDDTAVVWIDNKKDADLYYMSLETVDHTNIPLSTGYNVVPFGPSYVPFTLGWATKVPLVNKVYINDELTNPVYVNSTTYTLDLKNLDVVKIFLESEPVVCNVAFDVEEGVAVNVLRDIIVPVTDLAAAFTAFKGTEISIAPEDAEELAVEVNGQAVKADEDGAFVFTVADENTSISVKKNSLSGVASVEVAPAAEAIYNLHGQKMNGNLSTLPAGIYVVNGRKVVK